MLAAPDWRMNASSGCTGRPLTNEGHDAQAKPPSHPGTLKKVEYADLVKREDGEARLTAAEEIVDLVDEDDNVIGRAPRREVRARNLLHREVGAIVRNRRGEIYVHRRVDTKNVFPGMYDMFVAGIVTSGESYDGAIRRELAEELGIEGVEPAFLFKSRYRDADINWWTCGTR